MLARRDFRSFENFEYRLERKQLILGGNGTGKSSFLDSMFLVRQLAVSGMTVDEFPFLLNRTRWSTRKEQSFEVDAILDGNTYTYRLVLEPFGDPPRARIAMESLQCDGTPLVIFKDREVQLFSDLRGPSVTYPFDADRSALATIAPRGDNLRLTRFKQWLSNVFCFRINPYGISGRADSEDLFPKLQLDNLASWYRHLIQSDQRQNFELLKSLRSVMDDFKFLELQPVGENVRVMIAEFGVDGAYTKYLLNELSEGQRCLLCLYTILHFLIEKGATVFIDEPDNFISLREIQPWLMAASDAVDEASSQLILISHHPEILDQWAPSFGMRFFREKGGITRAKSFVATEEGMALPPSELIARGWIS